VGQAPSQVSGQKSFAKQTWHIRSSDFLLSPSVKGIIAKTRSGQAPSQVSGQKSFAKQTWHIRSGDFLLSHLKCVAADLTFARSVNLPFSVNIARATEDIDTE